MPSTIGECTSDAWFQEEISYEEHIARMDRARDERRDRVYPVPPRDRRIAEPTRDFRGRTLYDAYCGATSIEPKFKVGDEVFIDPSKVPLGDLSRLSSTGQVGERYIIEHIDSGDPYMSYCLRGSNWHKEEWLTLVPKKNLIGGRLL